MACFEYLFAEEMSKNCMIWERTTDPCYITAAEIVGSERANMDVVVIVCFRGVI